MQNPILLVLMYFSEWWILYDYAKSIYAKRSKFTIPITAFFYTLLMISYKLFPTNEILTVSFSLLCLFLCLYTGFKSTLKSSLFHTAILIVSQAISELAAIYTISFFTNSSSISYYENSTTYITDVVISKILYFAITRFLLKFANKESSEKTWGQWAALSILPISSVCVILVIRFFTNGQIFSIEESLLCILTTIVLFIANIVVFLIYEKAEESNQKLMELELTNQKKDTDIQYLNLLEKKNEQLQIITHDFKKNVQMIADMTDSTEINRHIESLVGEIKKYSQIAKTKNAFLDVILNKYTEICKDKGIRFETEVFTANLDFVSSYDLSSIFNNLLDNAVEAAEKSSEKYIHLEIAKSIGSYHKIITRNSCDKAPKSKNGILLTTKDDNRIHGFGTKSILKTIKNYYGEMEWSYDSTIKEFKSIILISDQDSSEK